MLAKKKQALLWYMGLPWVLLLAGCETFSITNHHGNMPKASLANELQPGTHRKADVIALLGAPSARATFDEKIWYYIGKTDSRVAFFNPDIVKSQVLIVTFNEDNILVSIDSLDKNANRDIAMIDRETPTAGGKSVNLIEQLLGNVGRFNRKIKR